MTRVASGAAASPVPVPPAVAPVAGRVGILGGTFDPVHHGHLAIAEEAREALGLERVLLVPCATPPHRGAPLAGAADRLRMVELAVAGNPGLAASPVEVARGGVSYTVDTLEALAAGAASAVPAADSVPAGAPAPGGGPDLVLVLSDEALAGFAAWREPRRILELARLAVLPRAGHPALDAAWVEARWPGLAGRVAFLPGPLLGVSASAIRARVAAGRSIRYLVPEAVARHIADHGLYTAAGRTAHP